VSPKIMPKATTDTNFAPSRLSIPLTADGQVDLDHMRPSVAQRFVDLIKTDPTIKETYEEVNAPANAPDGPDLFGGITSENVAKGLDAVATINGMVLRVMAARFVKHPLLRDQNGKPIPLIIDQQLLDSAFSFTPAQHAELDPRATRLAQKYSHKMPAWLKENLDLYMFVSMFLAYTAQNARTVLSAQITRDLARVRYNAASAAAAQPKNPQPDSDAQPVNGKTAADKAEEFGFNLGHAVGSFVADVTKSKPDAPPDKPIA
jgi:hypothetical protein